MWERVEEKVITLFTGPMHSGKTEQMISVYNKIWNKELVRVFKPVKDKRDYLQMKSKSFTVKIPAIGIETFDDILNYIDDDVRAIFIDEVQLVEGNVKVLSYLSIVEDIDVYVAGLNMTSEQEPFLIMPQVMAISDEVINVKASCFDCGREATYTYYDGEKTKDIKIGDTGYFPLCRKCLLKRNGKVKLRKRLLNIKKGK